MTTTDKKLAARFFFRNCSVSIHLPGEIKISRSIMPSKEDVIIPRDFHPAGETSEFLGMQSDFYKFLDGTSPSTAEFIKKLAAIGYMLCNKLPRGGRRCRAFCCINAEEGACANGIGGYVKTQYSRGWTNKMFVRADLMRHHIRITNVRMERLQDISDEDCIKEGIEWDHKAQRFYVRYDSKTHSRMWFAETPRETYSALIDSISGKGTWETNPYVFVYDFELVK